MKLEEVGGEEVREEVEEVREEVGGKEVKQEKKKTGYRIQRKMLRKRKKGEKGLHLRHLVCRCSQSNTTMYMLVGRTQEVAILTQEVAIFTQEVLYSHRK